jgi:hypothetical protein
MTGITAGLVRASCVISSGVVWAAVQGAPEGREEEGGFHEELGPDTAVGERGIEADLA